MVIQAERTSNENELLGLILRNPKLFLPWIYSFYSLDTKWIKRNVKRIDWAALSSNTSINWDKALIDQFCFRWNSANLSSNPSLPWSLELLLESKQPFHAMGISANKGIPWSIEIFYAIFDKLHLPSLLINPSIQWSHEMLRYINLSNANLSVLSGKNLWNTEFIESHCKQLNWSTLTYNPSIEWSAERIRTYQKKWDAVEKAANTFCQTPWKGISQNSAVAWSESFIRSFARRSETSYSGLHWKILSSNPHLPWKKENLLDTFESQLDWTQIGLNTGIQWTETLFDRFEKRMPWQTKSLSSLNISRNENLPWSSSFIEKYLNKWDWWYISRNEGIPFTKEFMHQFKDNLIEDQFVLNRNCPWTLEFILRHEKSIQESWPTASRSFKKFIWEIIFSPIVSDDFIERLYSGLENPYRIRSMVKTNTLSKFQQEIIQIGDEIEGVSQNNFILKNTSNQVDTFKDELQQLVYRIGSANQHELHLDYSNLKEKYSKLNHSEANLVINYCLPVYQSLYTLVDKTCSYAYANRVYTRYIFQRLAHSYSVRMKINAQYSQEYYTRFTQKYTHRPLEVITLLSVLLEFMPEIKNQTTQCHTSPF